ncbi:MAG: lipid-A-disaccharide synthase [Chitinivibrionales bacterium]|nr:lipid-A-disaccharide synthase [Chitinivibrionales bacterium]
MAMHSKPMPDKSIMFVAGDPSGDVHASKVVAQLRDREPETGCFGVGGPAMAAAGLEQVLPFEPFTCMGFVEVIKNLPFLLRAKRTLVQLMSSRKPSAVVLVDYAGFNIPIMKAAHRLGIPVLYYIAPKVWAWKQHRAAILGQYASVIATIFPFEVDWFKQYQARVEFVGNPLVEDLDARDAGEPVEHSTPKPPSIFRLAIVPGSRPQEIRNMLGPMIGAYMLLRRSYRQMRADVSRCSWLPEKLYEQAHESSGVELFDGSLDELLAQSDVALVTSGTATLETALRGIPHVIAYRTSTISYRIYKRLVKTPFIGLPNIVAGEQLIPECIQDRAAPAFLAGELEQFIGNHDHYRETVKRLRDLRGELGSKRPSEEVTRLILELADEQKPD